MVDELEGGLVPERERTLWETGTAREGNNAGEVRVLWWQEKNAVRYEL